MELMDYKQHMRRMKLVAFPLRELMNSIFKIMHASVNVTSVITDDTRFLTAGVRFLRSASARCSDMMTPSRPMSVLTRDSPRQRETPAESCSRLPN